MGLFEFLASLKLEFLCLATLISLPSILLSIGQIFVVICNREFHNNFYILFVVRAIMDILQILSSTIQFRLPTVFGPVLIPFYSLLPAWLFAVTSFANDYAFNASYIATAFILATRFTAIAVPFKHKKLWKKYLPFVLLAICCVPLYPSWLFISEIYRINVQKDENDTAISFDVLLMPNYAPIESMWIHTVYSFLFLIICSAISGATKWAYSKHRKERRMAMGAMSTTNGGMATNGTAGSTAHLATQMNAIDIRLLAYALTTLFGHILIAILVLLIYIYRDNMQFLMSLFALWPLIVDIGTVVISSWTLLALNEEMRKRLNIFAKFKHLRGTISPAAASQPPARLRTSLNTNL